MRLPNCYRCGNQPCTCADGCTIYHADCRDVLPLLEPGSVDLVLTDPPYGIGYDTTGAKYKNGKSYASVTGDSEPFDPQGLLGIAKTIMWGGNCFASRLPDNPGWLAWIKSHRNGANIRQAECEFAWTDFIRRSQCFRTCWIGAYKDIEASEPIVHPTQKPIALMKWCIGLADDPQTILDPFLGSGTTLRACKDLGRRGIGIEIEERYCEIAARRLEQGVLF